MYCPFCQEVITSPPCVCARCGSQIIRAKNLAAARMEFARELGVATGDVEMAVSALPDDDLAVTGWPANAQMSVADLMQLTGISRQNVVRQISNGLFGESLRTGQYANLGGTWAVYRSGVARYMIRRKQRADVGCSHEYHR